MPHNKPLNRCPVWPGFVSLLLILAGSALAQPRMRPASSAGQPSARLAICHDLQTIQNDRVKIGVDLCYGGAITYLSTPSGENMINNADLGRQAQIALYSNPNPYSENGVNPHPAWTGLGWNPIQAGDAYGNSSSVLTFRKQDDMLYVKTQPRHYGLNNILGEAYIEHWIKLEGNVAKVHAKVTLFRSDKTQYEARFQEMPSVYMNGSYHNIWAYQGNNPYADNGNLSHLRPPLEFGGLFQPTEPWMALTNNDGFGVGLYMKDCYAWNRGYFGSDYAGGEFSNDASYMAAITPMVLDHNIVHEWDYELIVGTVSEIRTHVWSIGKPAAGPSYQFSASREGWYYRQAVDAGWPVDGKLRVTLTDQLRDEIKSPDVFWQGNDNPKIYLRAAFQTQHNKFRLSWRVPGETIIQTQSDRQIDFPIINDGQLHTYEIVLKDHEGWQNQSINQIQFQPISDGPAINGWTEIDWIATSPNGPTGRLPDVDPVVVVEPCIPGCTPLSVSKMRYVRARR